MLKIKIQKKKPSLIFLVFLILFSFPIILFILITFFSKFINKNYELFLSENPNAIKPRIVKIPIIEVKPMYNALIDL